MQKLYDNVSDELFISSTPFLKHFSFIFSGVDIERKLGKKVTYGLLVMDKNAEIQHNKKG